MSRKKGRKNNNKSFDSVQQGFVPPFLQRLVQTSNTKFASCIPEEYEYLFEMLSVPKDLVCVGGTGEPVFSKKDKSFRIDRVFEDLLSEFDSEEILSLVPDTLKQSRLMKEFAGSTKLGKKEDTIWRRITGYPNLNRELTAAIGSEFSECRALEIMGGNGLLSYMLSQSGMKVICTDIAAGKDNDYYSMRGVSFCDIVSADALGAVRKFGAKCDLLICSWPPQGEEQVLYAFEAFKKVNPDGRMLYFGEWEGGVNAVNAFFERVVILDELEKINSLHIPHIGSKDKIKLLDLKSC